MNSTSNIKNKTGTHQVCFRISEAQYDAFNELLASIPGAEAGNLYRDIFTRGLKELEVLWEKHSVHTREEVAAEVGAEEVTP